MTKSSKDYEITEATYTMKLSVQMTDKLWTAFDYSLTAKIKPDANMKKVNEELWEKVIEEVENKIEESQKLYKG